MSNYPPETVGAKPWDYNKPDYRAERLIEKFRSDVKFSSSDADQEDMAQELRNTVADPSLLLARLAYVIEQDQMPAVSIVALRHILTRDFYRIAAECALDGEL